MKFRELEKLIKKDGWKLKAIKGSHYHYTHPKKPGKISIPCHKGDLKIKTAESVLKQAGLK